MTRIGNTAMAQPGPRSRPRRRTRSVAGALVGFLLFFCTLFFGLSWLVSPDPGVSANEAVAVTAHDGRTVVVVAYGRDGPKGMFQLIFQPMFQTRLAAIDADTGERIWDVRLDEKLSNDVRVLGAGGGLVYLATDQGLRIRSLADGSGVAEPDAIEGLGDGYVAETGSYDVDPDRELIVAIDQSGGLWQIPFGESAAVPADRATDAVWRPVLADDFRFGLSLLDTANEAELGGGTVISAEPIRAGAQEMRLQREGPSGSEPVGDTTFLEPRFVLDASRSLADVDPVSGAPVKLAADREAGQLIVVSSADANSRGYRVDTVDLDSGEVRGTADIEVGYDVGGGYAGEGVTAIVVERADGSYDSDTVLVVSPDGGIRTVAIGESNFFGWPR